MGSVKRAATAAFVALVAGPAGAETPPAEKLDLASCRAAVAADAGKGRELAAQWEALGGGAAAALCAGEALMATGAMVAAAEKLMEAGAAGASLSAADRVGALETAGELWISRGQDALARRSFRLALAIDARAREARLGLARLAAASGDFAAAEAELSAYLDGGATDSEALTLRAAARRRLGRLDAARADARRAVEIDPANAIGWFELGAAAKDAGDEKAAREAWLKAAILDPESPGGALAVRALQLMDGG